MCIRDRSNTLIGITVGAIDERSMRNTRSVGHGVGCRPVKVGTDIDTLRFDSYFSVGDETGITIGVDCIRSNTLIGSTVGAIDERRMRNTRSVGDGVGCRLVKVGIDLDTLRVDSCFSVGDGTGITVGVDCIRSNTLIGSTVGAIDERSMRNTRSVGVGVGCRRALELGGGITPAQLFI